MDSFPTRKRNRLKDYDYAQNGAYFVTLCVQGRQSLLGSIDDGALQTTLSNIGRIIDHEINQIAVIYDCVSVDKYVIMPNHVHMILLLTKSQSLQLSRVIKQFKGAVTKKAGRAIWQKSFFDRVIRSDQEYLDVWSYIENNPTQWALDSYYE